MSTLELSSCLDSVRGFAVQDKRTEFAARMRRLAAAKKEQFAEDLLWLPESAEYSELTQPPALQTPEITKRQAQVHALVIPGLLADSVAKLVAPFMKASTELALDGYQVQIAWVNGRRGCDHNAQILRDRVIHGAQRHGCPIHLIGYSKGCADALHMLAAYPDTHASVASLTSYAGVVHGSPLADQTSRLTRKMLQYLPLPGIALGDGRAVHDLTRAYRQCWLEENHLPESIAYYSIPAAARVDKVSRVLRRSYHQLAQFDPMNDSQVIWYDGVLPDSDVLAVVNADHWAVALPLVAPGAGMTRRLLDQNDFPRELVLRAVLDHIGSIKV